MGGLVQKMVVSAFCGGLLLAGRAGAQNLVVYQDALGASWSDWSYSVTTNFSNGAPVHAGTASIAVNVTGAYGALSLRTSPPVAGAAWDAIRFWVYGSPGGTSLDVFTQPTDGGAGSPAYSFAAPAATWTRAVVPLSALGSPSAVARINLQDTSGNVGQTFYVDDVELVAAVPGARETIADRVLGQASFTTGTAGTTATTLNGPAAVAVGPDGRLWVVDYENSRVLAWSSARDYTSGAAASLVLGQPNFTSGGAGTANNQFDHPEGVTVDPQGNVFVADTGNHRVMVFSAPFSNGMTRTLGFGARDPDPNCGSTALSNLFCFPRALASDSQGNLYLADEFHNRILMYQSPLTTDTTPDKQLTGLIGTRGVAVDASGNVYASDSENDVVREYDAPLAGNTTPDRTYGTGPDGVDCFNSAVPAPTAATLACPIDLAVDATGNLYVSDLYHNRVLAYYDPLSNNVPDQVFGQHGSFTTGTANGAGLDAEAVNTPLGLAFDARGSLYLADFGNNRLLAFDGVKGDFSHDSQVDLLFRQQSSGRNMLWTMSGSTRAGASWITPDPASTSWQVAGADDFDRDGRSDLVFWNSATGALEFWFMSGASRPGAAQPILGAPTLAVNWKVAATGDFNRDGRPDLLWRNYTSQKLVIWTLDGNTRVGAIVPTPDQAVDGNWEVVAALDYNKDGNRDLLWYNYTSGKIVVWYMDANVVRTAGAFTTPANAGDANWKVYAGGDFGVGAGGQFATNDIVWRNATSGRLVVWHMDSSGSRTVGLFTTPDSPTSDPDGNPTAATDWALVGPH